MTEANEITLDQANQYVFGGLPDNLSSPSWAKLQQAIAKARPNFKQVTKSKTAKVKMKSGGEYSYNFASLDDVIDAVEGPLAKEGVTIQQPSRVVERGVIVKTILALGDEWVSDYGLFQPANTSDAQSIGSAITYGRRYGLTSSLNIPVEDDNDGATAKAPPKTPAKKEPAAKLAPIDKRDALLTRIQALPDDLQAQIKTRLKDANVVWTQLTPTQLISADDWCSECEDIANSGG